MTELPEVPEPLPRESLNEWVERWRGPFNEAIALLNGQLREVRAEAWELGWRTVSVEIDPVSGMEVNPISGEFINHDMGDRQ